MGERLAEKKLYHTTDWSGKDETFMANPNNQNIGQLLKIKEEKRKKTVQGKKCKSDKLLEWKISC